MDGMETNGMDVKCRDGWRWIQLVW